MDFLFRFHIGARLALISIILPSYPETRAEDVMSRIKADERVIFFPTVARLSEDRTFWHVPIHGWIFEPEKDDALRGAVLREFWDRLGLDVNEPSTKILDERARRFLIDNERGKRIGIHIAGETHTLDPSGPDGHFIKTIHIRAEIVEKELSADRLRYEAITSPDDRREFHGVAYCLRPNGISVISDIDDTIKITDVLDKKELIKNTFFREFRAVEGMATVYHHWAEAGAQFHFVSASPWQLYEPLSEFTREAGFPGATFHLKRFRLKDSSFLKLFEDPIAYKLSVIEPLVRDFPQRTFILVGDSGEKDPEVYGIVARRYPEQVTRIYIRDVTGEAADAPRYQSAFRELSTGPWELFRDAVTLQWPGE